MDSETSNISVKSTVAVTGASGHIGNVVCRTLLEQGYTVRALYHSDDRSLQDLDVERIQGDVLNPEDLSRLIRGCDFVINCAAIISINGDSDGRVFKTNTEGPKNILEVSVREGVKKIIHVSSVHAVNDLPHTTPYDETRPYKTPSAFVYDYSKAMGEQILLKHAENIEVVIVRPSCVVGPYDFKPSKMGAALMSFYRQKILFLPNGGYDIVDVRDVSTSICEALIKGKNQEIYLLSGKYHSFKSIAEAIREVSQKKKPTFVLPAGLMQVALPFAWVYGKLTGKEVSVTYEAIVAIREGHPNMDSSKARLVLNHHPRPFIETLKDYYLWVEANANDK